MPDAPKSRFTAYLADARTDLLPHWNRVLREVDTRLLGVEGRKASFEEAEAQMRGIALARINEALLPAFLILETLVHFGVVFEATSETELTVGEGSKTLVIPADKRSLFAPASYLSLRKADDADTVMTGSLVEYSRESGVLTVLVDQTRGEGTHSAWSIAPSSAPQFDAYTRGQVDGLLGAAVTGLLGGAPSNLDTLAKIAASIGNEPDFAGEVSAALTALGTSLSQAANIATSVAVAGENDVDAALIALSRTGHVLQTRVASQPSSSSTAAGTWVDTSLVFESFVPRRANSTILMMCSVEARVRQTAGSVATRQGQMRLRSIRGESESTLNTVLVQGSTSGTTSAHAHTAGNALFGTEPATNTDPRDYRLQFGQVVANCDMRVDAGRLVIMELGA